MPTALLFLGLLAASAPVPHYTLTLDGDHFVIGREGRLTNVPLATQAPADPQFVAYRRDNVFAVWDKRGLTVRKGDTVRSTKFTDLALSSDLLSDSEVRHNRELIQSGQRRAAADALSGSKRLGQRVFFLVRWDDLKGKPWLEVLVEVDLQDRTPRPKIVGRFDGFSTAEKPLDDCLFLLPAGIATATRRENDWGIATYSFTTRSFDFVSMGDQLVSWSPSGLYTQKTSYGTLVGGHIEAATLAPDVLFEDRGTATWLDDDSPWIACLHLPTGFVMRNCETGAEQSINERATLKRVGANLLAYIPQERPEHAVL
ncbi:MAG TPA: hypothetical protein VG944_13195, partial [Fimbriimonas sp.]|nr:hypothetical protein [Fimbriimonas sp.]